MAGEVPGDAAFQHGNLARRGGELGDLGLEQRLLLDALRLFIRILFLTARRAEETGIHGREVTEDKSSKTRASAEEEDCALDTA